MVIWVVGTSNQLFKNFQKNKVITGKTLFFLISPFVVTILFVLTLASDTAVLYGNDALSILVLTTKKWYSIF